MDIVYLGPRGATFSELAYRVIALSVGFPSIEEARVISVSHNQHVIPTLLVSEDARGVLAVETWVGGRIDASVDTILSLLDSEIERIHVHGMLEMSFHIALFGNQFCRPETSLDTIECVLGHKEALRACRGHITERGWVTEEYSSNGEALEALSGPLRRGARFAALGPRNAALESIFTKDRLFLLADAFEDAPAVTKFLALSTRAQREPFHVAKRFGAMIVFDVLDRPGSLSKVLTVFGLAEINISYIHSVMRGEGLYRFCLFAEVEDRKRLTLEQALLEVQPRMLWSRCFGPFPIYKHEAPAP